MAYIKSHIITDYGTNENKRTRKLIKDITKAFCKMDGIDTQQSVLDRVAAARCGLVTAHQFDGVTFLTYLDGKGAVKVETFKPSQVKNGGGEWVIKIEPATKTEEMEILEQYQGITGPANNVLNTISIEPPTIAEFYKSITGNY